MTDLLPTRPRRLLGVLLALSACKPVELDPIVSESASEPNTTADPDSTGTATDGQTSAPGTSSPSTTDDSTTADLTTGAEPLPSCDEPVTQCKLDIDRDGVMFHCDNAPEHGNPDQSDVDSDGLGDVADLCPTLPGNDFGDADKDRIGNDCDLCPSTPDLYNANAAANQVSERMKVRNIPQVEDSDHDGIGDACDNCVRTPNCQGYGDADPYALGEPIDREALDCQADVDADFIGDACAGTTLPGAAGPVGFGLTDDFDQDGLTNADDGCPRQPVPLQACDGDEDCPAGSSCVGSQCGHVDSDNDTVGDICDTCPFTPNPQQIQMGQAEEDDQDGDFVGSACETHNLAADTPDPRPFGFYDGSANGYCCVRLHPGDTVLDPDGQTVPLPAKVLNRPGVGELPPGCTEEAQPVSADVGLATLWASFCLLPQWDQDFDGLGDAVDLCPFAFDPDNITYVDDNDKEWENYGKYCSGDYSPDNLDPAMMCLPGT